MKSRALEDEIIELSPDRFDTLLDRLVDIDADTARKLAQGLERRLGADPLGRIERVWGLSGAEVADVFGVSREAYRKWRHRVPANRAVAIAHLDHATDQLLAKLRVERIPTVVRTPAPLLDQRSLLDVARSEGPAAVADAVERLLDLRRVQP